MRTPPGVGTRLAPAGRFSAGRKSLATHGRNEDGRRCSTAEPDEFPEQSKERNYMDSSQKTVDDYVQTQEQKRLNDARESGIPWKKWGPYLSERQWGTVRE